MRYYFVKKRESDTDSAPWTVTNRAQFYVVPFLCASFIYLYAWSKFFFSTISRFHSVWMNFYSYVHSIIGQDEKTPFLFSVILLIFIIDVRWLFSTSFLSFVFYCLPRVLSHCELIAPLLHNLSSYWISLITHPPSQHPDEAHSDVEHKVWESDQIHGQLKTDSYCNGWIKTDSLLSFLFILLEF